jgi:hypothetical protein
MMYHRNRLIKPYVRVGLQLQSPPDALGVIGVVECDWLQPTHNKQDFVQSTNAYRNTLIALADRLNSYWWKLKDDAAPAAPVAEYAILPRRTSPCLVLIGPSVTVRRTG